MMIRRVFLGWDAPALRLGARWLMDRHAQAGAASMGEVVVATPGGRAGRRLLEVLVEEAGARELVLTPPRIVTAGGLAELLYASSGPVAGDLARHLAWVEAMRSVSGEVLARVAPTLPEAGRLLEWLGLAELVDRLHEELGAAGLDFSAVAERGEEIPDFIDGPRWRALATVREAYLAALRRRGLVDLQAARQEAIEGRLCRVPGEVVLLGASDLNAVVRQMLGQVGERVTALIHAPETEAEGFDAFGCIVPRVWAGARIELKREQVELADRVAEQAQAVVRTVAGLGGRYAAEQITVGVPDERVVGYVEQMLEEAGVAARHAAGWLVVRTGPGRLLAAVADFLDGRRYADFAALMRHPDVEAWLERTLADEADPATVQRGVEDWLTLLDRYYADHLQARLTGTWLGDEDYRERLERVRRGLEAMLGDLAGAARELDAWAEPIAELLVRVYGSRELDRGNLRERVVVEACECVHGVLQEMYGLRTVERATAAEAIRLVLRRMAGAAIRPEPDRAAVELLGWLELPLDDAPVLVVTGMNEGLVPESVNADPFLPNTLRRHLGLVDNERRYAREAYALTAMLHARERVKLIAGRRSAEGDPLMPSRLLFACDPDQVAGWIKAFYEGKASEERSTRTPGRLRARRPAGQSEFPVPQPRPLSRPVEHLSVTAFRDYLACPYRFYLRHVLRLRSLDDGAEEMGADQFGALMHEVLNPFGSSEAAAVSREREIEGYLNERLDGLVGDWFGAEPLPAVRVQVEQLRARLAAFARWQGAWVEQGWRIVHTEAAFEGPGAVLLVDGEPMRLRGRIDRIDRNEHTGEWMIFDYKTSDTPRPPDKVHRKGGEWVDLQLPLYRHLVASLGMRGEVGLGYLALPKDAEQVSHLVAGWSEEELEAADDRASWVVRQVRGEVFWPPAERPPAFDDYAAICGVEQILADEEEEGVA